MTATAFPANSAEQSSKTSRAPILLVAGAVAFNLVGLRAERNFTPLLNDASVHAQMVRAATAALRRGQLPLTAWYPYLGLGSPQFLHYQSLGAMLTGAAGLVVGPNRAFSWSLYLLVSLWPISVYFAGRLFGLSRAQAAVAAACAPFLFSDPNSLLIGYEPGAYLWIGYGLWSQLFAMWTLPIAWGASWRYVKTGKSRLIAILAGSATIAAHFMTGYLAILPIVLWVLIANGEFRARVRRGAIYIAGVALCSAWVVYPVIHYGQWASENEFLQHTGSADSYGARQVLDWLVVGHLFDSGRFPILTILFAIGIVACGVFARRADMPRAFLAVFILSLLLFFGRPTLGPIIDLVPGSHDLFLRRFLLGVQLAALFIAGVGVIAVKDLIVKLARTHVAVPWQKMPRAVGAAIAGVVFVAILVPAWHETGDYYSADAYDIALQQHSDQSAGAQIAVLITQLQALPAGRVYAGLPAPDWGGSFLVGQVPVFKYLSNFDFDMVGYTLRTASLMTDPEAYFDDTNPGDYAVFGIRYLVLPDDRKPIPRASLILASGPYRLWQVNGPGAGYVQLASTQGTIDANRTNIGAQTASYLASNAPNENLYRAMSFSGAPPAAQTLSPSTTPELSVGTVDHEDDQLDLGRVAVSVDASAEAAVVLKASFDPGWHATVDGVPAPTYMVSPALVAVTVSAGQHTVSFQYHGYRNYAELMILAFVTLVVLGIGRGRLRSALDLLKVRIQRSRSE